MTPTLASLDLGAYDGVICVSGDGMVHEVLNAPSSKYMRLTEAADDLEMVRKLTCSFVTIYAEATGQPYPDDQSTNSGLGPDEWEFLIEVCDGDDRINDEKLITAKCRKVRASERREQRESRRED